MSDHAGSDADRATGSSHAFLQGSKAPGIALLLALTLSACTGKDFEAKIPECSSVQDHPPPPSWPAPQVDPRTQLIYLAITDRFDNGDPSNDLLGATQCHDPTSDVASHGGDFRGLRRHLDYLQTLGVTALWSSPPYEQVRNRYAFGECAYHGYWPDFSTGNGACVDPRLGSPRDLMGLVDDLHSRGMAYWFDAVVNHTGYGARLLASRPDWFHTGETCGQLGDPVVTCPLPTRSCSRAV